MRDEHEDEAANLQESDEELMDVSYYEDHRVGVQHQSLNGTKITLDFGNQSINMHSNRPSISNQV